MKIIEQLFNGVDRHGVHTPGLLEISKDRWHEDLDDIDLICEIIHKAAYDSCRTRSGGNRDKARKFFDSQQFEDYCELLQLDFIVIKEAMKLLWQSLEEER